LNAKVPGLQSTITGSLEMNLGIKNSVKYASGGAITTEYSIYDDDADDHIVQDIGIDPVFGTYIFRTNGFFSNTSSPLEIGTTDYIPPVIGTPSITLDTSSDGIGPCENDAPLISVSISDESGIQQAWIRYSRNNGDTWYISQMAETSTGSNIWEGAIPSSDHGLTVLWYIEAIDNSGLTSIKKNQYNNPYSYTVLNRNPSVSLISPNGGETLQSSHEISWTASDPDTDLLSVTISYNVGNTGWVLIVADFIGTSYTWNLSSFTDQKNLVVLRVRVSDGYGGTAEDISDYTFTILPPPPVEDENTNENDDTNDEIDPTINGYMTPLLILATLGTIFVIKKRIIN
jgi:hypothetical protein